MYGASVLTAKICACQSAVAARPVGPVDAGVVDDGVHPAGVDLLRDAARFRGATEVVNDDAGRARRKVRDGGGAFARAGVQHDRVTFVDQRARRGEAEAVGAAGDEDARHHSFS
jgi:hypothetical protein